MNLKEYLKQKEPIRNYNVLVKRSEYSVATTIKLPNGELRSRVYFKTKNPLLAGIEYCLIGHRFYTTDTDGNPKNMSCFRIN